MSRNILANSLTQQINSFRYNFEIDALKPILKYQISRGHKHIDDIGSQKIAILIEKTSHLIDDLASIMLDTKLGRRHSGLSIERISRMQKVTLLEKRVVGAARKRALIVEQMNNTVRFLRDQVNARLIVRILDVTPRDLLACVLLLFELEYMFVEVELKRLVGVVDTKLLEAVRGEVLKPEYVQNCDRVAFIQVFTYYVVDAFDEPCEQT